MIKTAAKLKPWGNSLGILLPKRLLKKEHLQRDDEIEIIIKKKKQPLHDLFGELNRFKPRVKISTRKLLKEIDEEFRGKYGR